MSLESEQQPVYTAEMLNERFDEETPGNNKKLIIFIVVAIIVAALAFLFINEMKNQQDPYVPNNDSPKGDVKPSTNIDKPTIPTSPPEPTNTAITVDYGKHISDAKAPSNVIDNAVVIGTKGSAIRDDAPLIIKQAASNLYQQDTSGKWNLVSDPTKLNQNSPCAFDLNNDGAITSNEMTSYTNAQYIAKNITPELHNGVITYTNQNSVVPYTLKSDPATTHYTSLSKFNLIPKDLVQSSGIVLVGGNTSGNAIDSFYSLKANYSVIDDSRTLSALTNSVSNFQSKDYNIAQWTQYNENLNQWALRNPASVSNADGSRNYDNPELTYKQTLNFQTFKDLRERENEKIINNYIGPFGSSDKKSEYINYSNTLVNQKAVEASYSAGSLKLTDPNGSVQTLFNTMEKSAQDVIDNKNANDQSKDLASDYLSSLKTLQNMAKNHENYNTADFQRQEADVNKYASNIQDYLKSSSDTSLSAIVQYNGNPISSFKDSLVQERTDINTYNMQLQRYSNIPQDLKNQIINNSNFNIGDTAKDPWGKEQATYQGGMNYDLLNANLNVIRNTSRDQLTQYNIYSNYSDLSKQNTAASTGMYSLNNAQYRYY